MKENIIKSFLNKPETKEEENNNEAIFRPQYYGGKDDPYEAIKVIEAWELNFSLGSVLKYISRAGKKSNESFLKDLTKAKTYIEFEINRIEKIEKKRIRAEKKKTKVK